MGPTVGLFGFLARVNTVSTEKLYACTALQSCNIRPPGIQAVRHICNIRPLKVNNCRKIQQANTVWSRVFTYIGCDILFTPVLPPKNR